MGAKKIDKGAKPRIPASSLPNSTGLPWMMGRWLDTLDNPHLVRHRQLYNVNLPAVQLLLVEEWRVKALSHNLHGSFLGPLLIIIAINDLPKWNLIDTIMYADDTTIFGKRYCITAMDNTTSQATHHIMNNKDYDLRSTNCIVIQIKLSI